MSLKLVVLALLVASAVGCIPTVSPDDDDIMAQLEEMRTTMAMLEATATCGAECQSTSTLGTTTSTATPQPTTTGTTTTSSTTTTTPTTTTSTTTTTTTSTTTTTTTTLVPGCTPAMPVSPPTYTCGPDYIYGSSCYAFFCCGSSTWSDLEAQCEMYGGTLAIINSAGENAFIYQKSVQIYGTFIQVYIGLTRPTTVSDWRWPDCTSASYTNWGSESSTCSVMSTNNGQWFGALCTATSNYICEIPIV